MYFVHKVDIFNRLNARSERLYQTQERTNAQERQAVESKHTNSVSVLTV